VTPVERKYYFTFYRFGKDGNMGNWENGEIPELLSFSLRANSIENMMLAYLET